MKQTDVVGSKLRDPTLILAALFSFGFHGLLASFLIPSAPKSSIGRMTTVEVIWEKTDTSSQKQAQKGGKPTKSLPIKENRVVNLHKAPSQTKEVNYKPSVPQDLGRQGNEIGKGSSSSKPPSKITTNRKAYHPLPDYPWVCRKRRQEGKVFVDVKTNAEGQVLEVNLHKSSGYPRLDEVAIDAVKTWIFAEGNVQKVLILDFRLEG